MTTFKEKLDDLISAYNDLETGSYEIEHSYTKEDREKLAKELMQLVYDECCKLAEEKMLKTYKLEGMHYQSLQEMTKECGGVM
jgi:hypothetical protein